MDITPDTFWAQLPQMLSALADADYTAIDLEMTGVQVRDSLERGRLSMAQAYGRIRAAASTFSAVQLGITTVQWVQDAYQTRTFTIPISALLPQCSKFETRVADLVDRSITLSSRTVFFLRQQGISLQDVLEGGVPYLSRQELQRASHHLLQERRATQVDLEALAPDGKQVCCELRDRLAAWVASEPKMGSILELAEPRGGMLRKSTVTWLRQILQDEFPHCRCWTHHHGWVVKVTLRDAQRDQEVKQNEARDKRLALAKHYGLSWIFEALVGSSSLKDNEEMVRITATMLVHHTQPWSESLEQKWRHVLAKLCNKRSVLVGHNVVYDLAFIHAMMIGQLPQSLDDFGASIRALFPRVIDTKLLVSQTVDPDIVDQALEELYMFLQMQPYPMLSTAQPGWGFNQYSTGIGANKGSAHNAGFDSYMTAVVFVKTACKRMRLQRRLQPDSAQARHLLDRQSWHSLVDEKLCATDKFLKGHEIRLPDFESDFWAPVRNRLRLSTAGIIDLDT
ncbi:hypothetical protein CDD81_5182 [Ophiocordyceps australis]|uniref:Uncharacterized protein n=1 Tax=Ophiocordyceps australis TaxID=1399860 RepID=A0A2C5Y8L2_9HYPO|nr:hypothetical protein CDD81_5182 [Ophiocordyceps australis]